MCSTAFRRWASSYRLKAVLRNRHLYCGEPLAQLGLNTSRVLRPSAHIQRAPSGEKPLSILSSSVLGSRQLVLEEKPGSRWARVVFKREVVTGGLVGIDRDNFLHYTDIPRQSRHCRHVLINADAVAGLIV